MTLGKSVSMVFPRKNHGGIRLILTDDNRPDLGPGVQTVIDEDIYENYSGDITPQVIASLKKQAQKKIDDYRVLQAGNDDTDYQDAAATIDGQLDLEKVLKVK